MSTTHVAPGRAAEAAEPAETTEPAETDQTQNTARPRRIMSDIPLIELVHPMPGFPEHRHFALVELSDDGVLCALSSVDDPGLRFLVAPPNAFFPDYTPHVSDSEVTDLDIVSTDDVVVLVVLTAGASLGETTANLLAPVLLNTATRKACQVILDDPALSVRTPLVA